MVMSLSVALTLMVPAPPVVRSPAAVWVTPVPPTRTMSPLVVLTAAFTVTSVSDSKSMPPVPCAVTTLLTVRLPPASSSMSPLPASVCKPVPLMVRLFASLILILPLVVLVASSVARLVSIASAEPIPVAAVSVAWPAPVMLVTEPPSASLMLPVSAVRVMVPALLATEPLFNPMLPVELISCTVPAEVPLCFNAATVNPLASRISIVPPAPVLVALSVPMSVLMSLAEPIPASATNVAVPEVVRLAVSAAVVSEMAPAVAVTLIALLVVLIWPSTTLVPAARFTLPLPVA